MKEQIVNFETKLLSQEPDYLAPDGSEIRLLPRMQGGSLCHCTLPVNQTSSAVAHKTVEELWYVIQSRGEVWRKLKDQEDTVPVYPGVSLTIPIEPTFNSKTLAQNPCVF